MKISNFRLENQRTISFNFVINKEYEMENEITYNFGTEVTVGKNDEIPNKALVTMKFEVFKKGELEQNPYYLETTIEGLFSWDEEEYDEDTLKILLNSNAPAVLLSYIRTNTALITTSAGFPPLVIPLMNFAK
jgi:preprotein translocase subunit SecB